VNANLQFVEEQTLIYPSGNNVVLYNHETKQQKFILPLEKSEGISTLNISSNKKWLALAEKGKKPQVLVYEIQTNRRRKILSVPEMESSEFVAVAFSGDSKFLFTLSGGPDWILYFWSWEKAKVLCSAKIAGGSERIVQTKDGKEPMNGFQCATSPTDSSLVSVVGNGTFKIFRYAEGALRLISQSKSEQRNILAHCWIAEDRIACGTNEGKILVFDINGELKSELQHISNYADGPRMIRSMVSFQRGLLIASDGGTVALYEKSEEGMNNNTNIAPTTTGAVPPIKDQYKKIREFSLPDEQSNIVKIAINATEDSFVCATENSQLYFSTVSNSDVKSEDSKLELYTQPFHHGGITGLDTCIRKPLVVTCSTDRSVRVWNYVEDSSELVKYFPEESYSVAIHPSGLYILVGFSDKLRLMNLLIDDIRPFREFTIRGCRECKFSNGGQYFAAVTGSTIQIYSTWSFEVLGTMKGHNGKVKSICWSANDATIITAGSEGAIYEWSLKDISGFGGQGIRRESESILKTCSYSSVCLSTDGKTIYAVGSHKSIKEIVDGQIVAEIPTDVVLTHITLSYSGKMMFVGTQNGTIRAIKYPWGAEGGEYQEHQAHSGPVTKMCTSIDDNYLFSVSEDGSFYVLRIFDRDSRLLKREREMVYADEILVTKSDLEEKNTMMAELKTRVEELKMENEYQLRLKDMNFNEKIKQVSEKFTQEIETLKITSTVLRTEKEKEEVRHEEEMAEEKERYTLDLQDMEVSQNAKLMAEYEKYQELQAKTAELQEQWEHQMKEMQIQKNKALEELNNHFEERIKEKQAEMDQIQDAIKRQIQEYEETTRETELDADAEMSELRHRYEKKLKEEREIVLRLKGENGIMRKKFNTLQGEIDTHKGEISKMYNEEKKLHSVIKSLEKDIAGLKKEVE
jgi:WD40 repeat protein